MAQEHNPNHQADIKNHNNTTLDRNNAAYKNATNNHADQLNPNSSKFQPVKTGKK